ncbi:hypothetical protein ACIG5E_28670 [Kitasatospora sp. NPDC053057]|uniref:hypothetical protein n=1 Tax=Kitasatospora sp. NPDC053057 TaxID=3364062 RepID=UPI0037C8C4ED
MGDPDQARLDVRVRGLRGVDECAALLVGDGVEGDGAAVLVHEEVAVRVGVVTAALLVEGVGERVERGNLPRVLEHRHIRGRRTRGGLGENGAGLGCGRRGTHRHGGHECDGGGSGDHPGFPRHRCREQESGPFRVRLRPLARSTAS